MTLKATEQKGICDPLSKCLPQPLSSPWCRFPSQSYNYFRYPSAILEFMDEGSVGWGWHIHQWNTSLQNIV